MSLVERVPDWNKLPGSPTNEDEAEDAVVVAVEVVVVVAVVAVEVLADVTQGTPHHFKNSPGFVDEAGFKKNSELICNRRFIEKLNLMVVKVTDQIMALKIVHQNLLLSPSWKKAVET